MERKISIAIPHYNNTEFIEQCLKIPLEDERISEIIIIDDFSSDLKKLKNILEKINSSKIKLYENDKNLGCYHNKLLAVSKCTNDWCILFDSDNYFNKDYIDKLYEIEKWDKFLIYIPDHAITFPGSVSENLNFQTYSDKLIDKKFYIRQFNKRKFKCLINTCNYFIPKKEFLSFMKEDYNRSEIDCLDSAVLFTDWLLNNNIKVVKGLRYYHRIHPNSNYTIGRSRRFEKIVHEKLLLKIRNLK